MIPLNSPHLSCFTPSVAMINVRSIIQQQLHRGCVTSFGGTKESSVTLIVLMINVRSIIQQQLHSGCLTSSCSAEESCVSILQYKHKSQYWAHLINNSSLVQQQANNILVSCTSRNHTSCGSFLIRHIVNATHVLVIHWHHSVTITWRFQLILCHLQSSKRILDPEDQVEQRQT